MQCLFCRKSGPTVFKKPPQRLRSTTMRTKMLVVRSRKLRHYFTQVTRSSKKATKTRAMYIAAYIAAVTAVCLFCSRESIGGWGTGDGQGAEDPREEATNPGKSCNDHLTKHQGPQKSKALPSIAKLSVGTTWNTLKIVRGIISRKQSCSKVSLSRLECYERRKGCQKNSATLEFEHVEITYTKC